jgi:DNA helicase-2/ATP-dependent DNA helicase PcrA
MLPAIAIHIWKLPNINIEQRKEALTSLGKFVASAYFSGQSIDRNNQSCPEEIRSKIKWRLFLSDTLKLCCNNSLLSNPETTWKDWAKAFRETINDIISECSRKNEIIIDFEQAEKYTAPRGESDQKVSSTTETIHCNPSQPVRITNFHQIKGETLESVMVVSSPTNQGGGEGYWKNWLNDPTSENARFAYVASTRPKKLLIWAVPDRLDQTDKDKLQSLGFVITDTL